MRVGIQNIIEAFCALGYGNDKRLKEAWEIIGTKKDKNGKYVLNGTLSKSYLPKEKVGRASKWVTFYVLDLFDNRRNDRIRHGTREEEKRRKRTGIQAAFWSKS
jgi:hypothetical protein